MFLRIKLVLLPPASREDRFSEVIKPEKAEKWRHYDEDLQNHIFSI